MKTRLNLIVLVAVFVACSSHPALLRASPSAYSPPAGDLPSGDNIHGEQKNVLAAPLADDPSPPASPVKLIFIHHSTGGNWLASSATNDPSGDLGQTLMNNNYFVSATNYGWGPDQIGSNTDIPNWPDWFTGPERDTILAALYAESDQNICNPSSPSDDCFGDWPRLATDPGGENEIIMFKSCFPNSDLYGDPNDPPDPAPGGDYTVGNAKAVYNDILTYFAARQDKLFIVITAPPMAQGEYTLNDPGTPAADRAANARALNNWLLDKQNGWLKNYTYNNVAVFDYYNTLTSNGSATRIDDTSTSEEPNDYASRPDGNHHYWNSSQIVHSQTIANNFSAYPTDSVGPDYYDSHPTTAGHQKATSEFVPLLNIFYHRWKGGAPPTPSLTLTSPNGGENWTVNTSQQIQWTSAHLNGNIHLEYSTDDWDTTPNIITSTANTGSYAWTVPNTPSTNARVRVSSVLTATISDTSNSPFTIAALTPTTTTLTLLSPNGGESWPVNTQRQIRWSTTGTVTQINLYYSTDGFVSSYAITTSIANAGVYTWTTPPTPTTSARVRVESVVSSTTVYDVSGANFTLYTPGTFDHFVYLPLVLKNYASAPSTCPHPLTGVTISGPTSGYTNTTYTFTANPAPSNATTPIAYTWSPAPGSGQGTGSASYQWDTTGSKSISVSANNCGGTVNDNHTITIQSQSSGGLVQPGNFAYLGAFRLPDAGERPYTFEYGGNAMTFNPSGNPTSTDCTPGSLFIMGHNRLPDELPNGNQVAEISIPEPTVSSNLDDLNYAEFLQGFQDVAAGHFTEMNEIPRVGMAYLNHPATGPKIHLAWGLHMPLETPAPTHAWFDPNLLTPNFQGEWFLGDPPLENANDYMFEIPAAWADANASGRYLGAGRFRDGGWWGMGPALFAYRPWLPDGSAPVSGTHLAATRLLQYRDSDDTPDIEDCLTNYQHPDEWRGGAWLTTSTGKNAVLFAGTKSNGTKYWYGWVNPAGASLPCIEVELVDQFTTCRWADGTPCPDEDLTGCTGHNDNRGWWSTHFDAEIILYDPADLAQVAAGTLNSWEPQPHATMDTDEHLYFNPPESDRDDLGIGDQRSSRIGDVAYDRAHDLLYVIELYGDEAKPVVHVWRVQ